jgi:S-adenosylmethionine/arginine decarboxylase-like enzyme
MEHVTPWGKSAAIDVFECEHSRLTDPELLKEFVAQVVKVVDMEAHGPCYVDRFGDGDLEGYSAMQFIKTSAITVHLDETNNRAFIDIFSCKDFDAAKAEQFTRDFFGGGNAKTRILNR